MQIVCSLFITQEELSVYDSEIVQSFILNEDFEQNVSKTNLETRKIAVFELRSLQSLQHVNQVLRPMRLLIDLLKTGCSRMDVIDYVVIDRTQRKPK